MLSSFLVFVFILPMLYRKQTATAKKILDPRHGFLSNCDEKCVSDRFILILQKERPAIF